MENNIAKTQMVNRLLEQVKKHPYLIAAFVCFAATWFGYGSQLFIDGYMVFGIGVICIGCLGYGLFHSTKKGGMNKWVAYIVLAGSLWLYALGARRFMQAQNKAFWVLVAGFILVILLNSCLMYYAPEKREAVWILCLAMLGFVLRYAYVLETDVTVRQNDVGVIEDEEGHMGYINYLVQNHHLPDFDPTTRWQFYHPPLHHIFCAIWKIFCMSFGLEDYVPYEALQILPLFYSCVIMILSYKIMCCLKLRGKARWIPFALICFFPYLIQLSGALNNDALSICFIMGAVYTTIVWYKEQRIRNIIKIALCIGLGMMTKLSVGLVAPAVAFVFLYVLIKKRKEWWNKIKQYFIFGMICCPLGLWWGVRNLIKYKIPLNYIPTNDGMMWQYIGDISIVKRFTDFSLFQVKSPFVQWGNTYLDYNPLIVLNKMAMFGEEAFEWKNMDWISKGLFWLSAVLAIVFFLCFVVSVIRGRKLRLEKIFLFLVYAVILGNFYIFCINYPYTCTMNFRYIVPCMLLSAYGMGIWLQKKEESSRRIGKMAGIFVAGGVIVFGVFSVLLYGSIFYLNC